MGHPETPHGTSDEAARKAAYRERKKREALDAGRPWQGLEGELREQAIRDFFGFMSSVKSSQAERAAVALRIAKSGPSTADNPVFSRAFPARPNDLAPTPEQLKRLGETTGSKRSKV